ncbi:alpha/beta fold hydrolase [Actinokineospora bangkokensis]|uniref:Alpha/beta hydrolase n=1 Tax=Actinokineospora bangkokensis TaxID=1193682 RepID=A0A1Q9LPR1_9PSEU|nr:alpha/beta hydrolase [Actinokineospora bangkokensis]OLR93973.1 alpha/beta hydrolase [Actinokineospora bangkokensis]
MTEYGRIETPAGLFDAITDGEPGDPPVLLLHGFPQAALEWEHQVGVLGHAGWHAVAFDQRGYSPDVRPDDVADYRMEHLVADVVAVVDALGWSTFDLVGHDWGAAVAWNVAAGLPQRVRTLTAVSVPHPGALTKAMREDEDQAARSHYMQVFQERSAEKRLLADDAEALRRVFEWRVPESSVQEYVARLREPGALTAALNWYRAMRHNPTPDKVSVPTMFVWSTEDSAIGSTAALSCDQWVTGPYRFEMLEDVSHWVPEEAPDLMTGLLIDHLR